VRIIVASTIVPFIHGGGRAIVDDLVTAIVAFMATPPECTGPLNLGNPNAFRVIDLAEKIVAMTGSRSRIELQPLPADDPSQRQPDIALARRHLSWEPRTQLDAGLTKTIEYFEALQIATGTRRS